MNANIGIVTDCFDQCVFDFDKSTIEVDEKQCMEKCALKHDFMTAVDRKNKPKYLKDLEKNSNISLFEYQWTQAI